MKPQAASSGGGVVVHNKCCQLFENNLRTLRTPNSNPFRRDIHKYILLGQKLLPSLEGPLLWELGGQALWVCDWYSNAGFSFYRISTVQVMCDALSNRENR